MLNCSAWRGTLGSTFCACGAAACARSGHFGITATGLGSWRGRSSRWRAPFWITTRAIARTWTCWPQRRSGTVRALRNHPSLIAWCGGNEISPRRERLPLDALARVLAEEDPARPWIPASPCDGDLHHWQVWHGFAPWTDLAGLDAPFMSEFGLQALPDAATVAEMFPTGAPAALADPRWVERKAQIDKLRHYAGPDAAFDRLRARPCRCHRGHAARSGDSAAGRDRGVPAAPRDARRPRRGRDRLIVSRRGTESGFMHPLAAPR